MVVPYAERLVSQSSKGRLTPTQTRVLERKIQKKISDEPFLEYKVPPRQPVARLISREKSRKVGRAVTGILGALMPQEAMAGAVSYTKKGTKGDRGRGRPHGTYKARYVPGYGTVKVPTNVYRRMMSKAKSDRRLAEAQAQAKMQQQFEAEQIAMTQRAGYEQPDQFLESPDMEHEARLEDINQLQYQQQYQQNQQQAAQQSARQRSGFATKAGEMFGKLSSGLFRPQNQPQQYGQAQQRPIQGIIRPQINERMYQPSNPQVIVTGGKSMLFNSKSNLLNQKNEFNKPQYSVIGRGGVRKRNHL